MIDKKHKELSIRRQSELLSLNRSSLYMKARSKINDLELCNIISEIYLSYPIYGYRRIRAMLVRLGIFVNHKRVSRLMKEMNIRAIYPKPNTSKKDAGAILYPYLLPSITIDKPHKVWQVDITYLRTNNGFMYLVALIDMYSRMVVGWRLSNDLQTESCLVALQDAIMVHGLPEIINSDQGSQFTSEDWIRFLQNNNITVSMTGKGRCNDNANIERLWRSFKYEGSYLYKWHTVQELKTNIPQWVNWYNSNRPHQALNYKTPVEKYREFMGKPCDLPTISQYQIQSNDLNFVFAL
jgi:putative transposase